jgi:4-amino-4-deoxy-L-arabinose transferase-like glycosyltransferase
MRNKQLSFFMLLGALFILAFAVRFWNLENLPSGLWIDEAVNAADAHTALETGNFKLFYPNNYGREGLFINLQALSLWAFGSTITALKLWSAIFGTLAVMGVYLLGKEIFARRAPAFFAAFSFAFSYWAINFSRIGFRAIMTSAILSFCFYFFFRGLRREKPLDFLWAGFFLGLGLHGYIASRLVPLIFIILLPLLFLSYQNFLSRFWKQGLVFVLGAFISAAPMLYHFFWSHPEDFASRSTAISIFAPEVNGGDFVGTLSKTFTTSLQKYNFIGDANWRHNYPPYPILDPITGMFFLSSFLFMCIQFFGLFYQRIKKGILDQRLVRNGFLLATFFIMLMPEFLTVEGLPHALRSIGTQVPVFLMTGFGIHWLYRYGERSLPFSRTAFHALIILLLIVAASINLVRYFVFFGNSPEQKQSFTYAQKNITRYIETLPTGQKIYVTTNDKSRIEGNNAAVDLQPLIFYTYGKDFDITYLAPGSDAVIESGSIIIMAHQNKDSLSRIIKFSPLAQVEKIDYEPGTKSDFTIIRIP